MTDPEWQASMMQCSFTPCVCAQGVAGRAMWGEARQAARWRGGGAASRTFPAKDWQPAVRRQQRSAAHHSTAACLSTA